MQTGESHKLLAVSAAKEEYIDIGNGLIRIKYLKKKNRIMIYTPAEIKIKRVKGDMLDFTEQEKK